MKNIWKYIIGLLLLVGVVALLQSDNKEGSYLTNDGDQSSLITIGAPLSLSGYAAADGVAIKNGIDLAVKDLQEEGIEVIVKYQDDQTDAKQTVSAIRSIGNVDAVVGPTWSFLADAGLPVFEQSETVAIVPAVTTEVIQSNNEYAFFGSVKNELKEKPLADFFRKNNIKRIAFLGDTDAWGKSHREPLYAAALSAGAEVVVSETVAYGTGASVLPTIITKIKQENVDLVFHTLFDHQDVVKLINDINTQDLNIPVVGSDTTQRFIYESDPTSFTDISMLYGFESSIDVEFDQKYQDSYGMPAPSYSDRGYDAVMILVDAILNKGDKTLKDYLTEDTNYSGYAAVYDFDENGDLIGGEWVLTPLEG